MKAINDVLFVGCGHRGIINILKESERIRQITNRLLFRGLTSI